MPQAQTQCGVNPDQVNIAEDALGVLIRSYCRESGVRNLQKQIEKVSHINIVPTRCLRSGKVLEF